ncbi:MAG: PepSY domain-containing protein, partial [Clostridia bacterium]|nr:PepSY domain-containing protein [Clostridia bacterium]
EKDIKEFKKDRDDGKTYYDGKIVYDKKEYEFEIDAQTGTITEWDIDSVNE